MFKKGDTLYNISNTKNIITIVDILPNEYKFQFFSNRFLRTSHLFADKESLEKNYVKMINYGKIWKSLKNV